MAFLDAAGLSWEDRAAFLMRPNDDPVAGPERLAHLYAREYVELGYATAAEFERCFKFAVVRNPYDRFVSEYLWRYPGMRMSAMDFLQNSITMAPFTDLNRHIVPQKNFVTDASGAIVVDQILRFEEFETTVRALLVRLLGTSARLAHRNASKSRVPKENVLDEKLVEALTEYYAEDFSLFGYPRR
jgi:hypothetical protein